MKRLLIIAVVAIFSMPLAAQGKLYVLLELMHVDNEQEFDYMETEKFWKNIHQKRLDAGEIVGWDLWALLPGGEDQGYQYATATLFDSPEKMFEGFDFWGHAKAAYPEMSEEEITNKLISTNKSRDLAIKLYMETIAETKGDFKMVLGMVANMNLMKVDMDKYEAYEKAEVELFKPMHQKMVDSKAMGYWGLLRFMVPTGSATYASHMTVDMFENVKGALHLNDPEMTLSAERQKTIEKGLQTRDLKFTYMAYLLDMVR